jgi:hypothetical protein
MEVLDLLTSTRLIHSVGHARSKSHTRSGRWGCLSSSRAAIRDGTLDVFSNLYSRAYTNAHEKATFFCVKSELSI